MSNLRATSRRSHDYRPPEQRARMASGTGQGRPPGVPSGPGGRPSAAPSPRLTQAPRMKRSATEDFVADEFGMSTSVIKIKEDSVLGRDARLLESENFNCDAFVLSKCQAMSEKAIRRMCVELSDYKRVSAEEMRKSVVSNYKSFIRTAREISDLEGELRSMRSLLTAQSSLIHTLGEKASLLQATSQPEAPASSSSASWRLDCASVVAEEDEDSESAVLVRGLEGLCEQLRVCLAERRVGEALRHLRSGEEGVSAAKELWRQLQLRKGMTRSDSSSSLHSNGGLGGITRSSSSSSLTSSVTDLLLPDAIAALESELSLLRSDLSGLLADIANQPCVQRAELCSAVATLAALGESQRAHALLLRSHGDRLRAAVRPLRPAGLSYGSDYAHRVSRIVFSHILQAAQDSLSVFGGGGRMADTEAAAAQEQQQAGGLPTSAGLAVGPLSVEESFASQLVLWAHDETEWCAQLLQRHVLSSAAAAGGLRSAAECVQIAMGHCSLLEEQGLAMAPVLMRLVRPSVEMALEANIRRIEESVNAMAAADDWSMMAVGGGGKAVGGGGGQAGPNLKLTSSAYRLFSMVQEFLEDVVPIVNMQLTTPTLDGLAHLYKQYIAMLNRARAPDEGGEEEEWDEEADAPAPPRPSVGPIVGRAETEKQQLALIANAAVLADELPRLASRLTQPSGGAGGGKEGGGAGAAAALRERQRRDVRRSSGGESKRQQLQAWKKGLGEGVENLRMAFCLQRATELLYPDAYQEDAVLPALYFLMDQDESDPGGWRESNPMPSRPMQHFLDATMSISSAASEVLTGRDRMALQLLTQFGLALLTLVCHDKSWEDSQFFLGPVGLRQFLLDIQFLKEVAAKYHFTSRQLQQVADTSMERARETFDINRDAPTEEELKEIAHGAMAMLLQVRNQRER